MEDEEKTSFDYILENKNAIAFALTGLIIAITIYYINSLATNKDQRKQSKRASVNPTTKPKPKLSIHLNHLLNDRDLIGSVLSQISKSFSLFLIYQVEDEQEITSKMTDFKPLIDSNAVLEHVK